MKMEGLEALQRSLVRTPELVKSRSYDAALASNVAIAQSMRALVQVDTGTLKRSIYTAQSRSGITASVQIGPEGFYWKYLEYGRDGFRDGRGAKAFPFIRVSAENESGPFQQRFHAIARDLERDFSGGRFL